MSLICQLPHYQIALPGEGQRRGGIIFLPRVEELDYTFLPPARLLPEDA